MTIKVLMPALSPTMEEGTLAKWLVSEGDTISAGDVIAEIETDKATMEVEAVDEGRVGKLLVAEGTEGVKVNAVIALLLEEGEDEGALEEADTAPPVPRPGGGDGKAEAEAEPEEEKAPAKAEPAAQPQPEAKAEAPPAPKGDGKGAPTELPGGPMPSAETAEGERIFASPLAKRMAQQAGLELAALSGSGPRGRIVKADIEAALAEGGRRPAAPAMPEARPGARQAPTEVEMSGVQKVIAERLTTADRDVPQFYLTVDIEIDKLLAARADINAAAPKDPESGEPLYKVSVNDMLIKAAAAALLRHPEVNAQWNDGKTILRLNTVDVAVAVATERGLITPIVFDADLKGVGQIARDMKDLAGRAKTGKLKPEEYQGGGFSISNLGMYGMKAFTSIINPPSACILAVGAGEERPVVRGGALTTATLMTCTLTCDHRVVDGALGARWLATFKALVEAPATMLA